MLKRQPTNPELQKLISELGKQKEGFYRDLARHLSKAGRKRSSVNLRKISKVAGNSKSIAVPGKVLSEGELEKPVKVYAWRFSQKSKEKITKTGGSALPLSKLLESKEKARIVV